MPTYIGTTEPIRTGSPAQTSPFIALDDSFQMKGVRLLRKSEPYVKTIKKITMRSILKRIAVRKNYKENIYMEAGVDPTNLRTAADLLANSAIISSIAFRLHSAIYLHSVTG